MPNTRPPVTTVCAALAYHEQLAQIEPNVKFMMTLYLTSMLTVEEIHKAAKVKSIVTGIKFYPRGATTHSSDGVVDILKDISPEIFQAMSDCGLVLHLHGECTATDSVLDAEAGFLATLKQLAAQFPRLKIVLEHVTTEQAVKMVRDECGTNVACTITPHHLCLTMDDVFGNPFHYCKPVAKTVSDREALWRIIKEGHPRFFLGSDSAPHPMDEKSCQGRSAPAAGIYSLKFLAPLLATLFEEHDCFDKLENFACRFGPKYMGLEDELQFVTLKREQHIVPNVLEHQSGLKVVPFYAGRSLSWKIVS